MPHVPQLKRLREEAALSQRDLAERAGIARETVITLEAGETNARPTTIRRLADALGCEPKELWDAQPTGSLSSGSGERTPREPSASPAF